MAPGAAVSENRRQRLAPATQDRFLPRRAGLVKDSGRAAPRQLGGKRLARVRGIHVLPGGRALRGQNGLRHRLAHDGREHQPIQVEGLVLDVGQARVVVLAHPQGKARGGLQGVIEEAAQSGERDLDGRGRRGCVPVPEGRQAEDAGQRGQERGGQRGQTLSGRGRGRRARGHGLAQFLRATFDRRRRQESASLRLVVVAAQRRSKLARVAEQARELGRAEVTVAEDGAQLEEGGG